MRNDIFISPFGREQFNTLAQSGTSHTIFSPSKQPIVVNGKGTELKNTKALKGRVKRKLITQKMTLTLADIATKKGDFKLAKSYWNTFYCQNRVHTSGGLLYGKYCKNRNCTICACIRKAEIINKYLPIIQMWKEPYFVTLTVKAVPASKLRYMIEKGLIRGIRMIISRYKKRNQRGKGRKLMGIKSLECNFNPVKRTYNPHFHLIVPDKQTADTLIDEWLQLWTKKFTHRDAQDSRKVWNSTAAMIETVKYVGKILTEAGTNKKVKRTNSVKLYARALNNIISVMKGHRVFERFGFNLPPATKMKGGLSTILNHYDEWQFESGRTDWINKRTGQKLSNYLPPPQLTALLTSNINTDLE